MVNKAQAAPAAGSRAIPVLSFFSGAGFLDIGFLRAEGRFSIPWHNECHPPFIRAYEHGVSRLGYNSGGDKIQCQGKIENLRAPQVIKQAFNGSKPPMFGIIGGPPCPDFSRAGKNGGGKGQNGRLTRHFVKMIAKIRPPFFLLENVPGLLETKKHRAFLFSMLKILGEFYAVDMRILNALEYGVPQNRRRVFVVGVCQEWLARQSRHNGSEIIGKSNKIIGIDISPGRTSSDVAKDIDGLHWFCWPSPKYKDAARRFALGAREQCPEKLSVAGRFAKINGHPNAGDIFRPYSGKFRTIKPGDVSRKSFKRLHGDIYSPNAAYGNNEVHLHPSEPRRISVAEALALQAVPEKYAFPDDMTLTAKFKAVGNGVPVPLAQSIAQSLANFLNEEKT